MPDGDTGTNLYLTVESAVSAVNALASRASVREVVDAFAHGALLGARGNSGIIAAQLLRGWADVLGEHEVLDGAAAKQAVRRADEQAWRAVAVPVEGTILSVSRAVAHAAEQAADTLPDVVSAMVTAAREAVARTRDQLEVLRQAGVVDAGARGYLVVLEALDDLVHRRPRPRRRAEAVSHPGRRHAVPVPHPSSHSHPSGHSHPSVPHLSSLGPQYEVMYLLDGAPPDALREALTTLGDSVVVVGDGRVVHVHVHTDDPRAVVRAAQDDGPTGPGRAVRRVRITKLVPDGATPGLALVACAAGPGLAVTFAEAGAQVVPLDPGGVTVREVLGAVRAAGRARVALLPNGSRAEEAARAAALEAAGHGIEVTVLPARSAVAGLAAAAVHDPDGDPDDDLARLERTVRAVRAAAVVDDPDLGVLGTVGAEPVLRGSDVVTVGAGLLDRLLAEGGELVTIVTGAGAVPDGASLAERVRHDHPGVELVVLDGGQAAPRLELGVE